MKNLRFEALIVAVGMAIIGILVYMGFKSMAERDRSVQVRGFSERIVPADKVTWPVKYRSFGNDVESLYADCSLSKQRIEDFFHHNGISDSDISASAPKLIDYETREYKPTDLKARYAIEMTVTVATSHVDIVRKLTYRISDLVRQGVSIASEEYGSDALTYEFTALEKVKPEMIELSTRNAREAAEKFAKDSGSKLGKIKTASQGYFSIEDRDSYTPWMKKVRVVTSIEYYLNS